MTISNLDDHESVSLRQIWPNETSDFTPWLAKNLHLLGKEIGIELSLVQAEKHGWSGYLDILAKTADGTNVAIENQLEPSDSDHMARLIGYAINHEANVLVWIAPHFYEYHQRILSGLKKAMRGNKEIFAVEISAEGERHFRPAVAETPASGFRAQLRTLDLDRDWPEAPDVGLDRAGGTDRFALFYRPLVERLLALDIRPLGTTHGGFTGRWRSFSTGYERVVYGLRVGTGGRDEETAVFLEVRTENRRQIFDALLERRLEMQETLAGVELECYDLTENCGLLISAEASVDDPEERQEETRDWMFRNLRRLMAAAQPHVDAVMTQFQAAI